MESGPRSPVSRQASSAEGPAASVEERRLRAENQELKSRLEFVEELVGPTEAQRKVLQEKVVAARAAALRAKYRGASIPTHVTGRLDERLLWSRGLSERDAGLLQGGCLPDKEGILQDVSLLGDPSFMPYDQTTKEVKWNARGGMLQLSIRDVAQRFGDEVAQDVVRCSRELDRYDASRRVGVELPWHPMEHRELDPAEVIDLMDRELSLKGVQASLVCPEEVERPAVVPDLAGAATTPSPYAAMMQPPPRLQRRRPRNRSALGQVAAANLHLHQADLAVHLPQVHPRRHAGSSRCAPHGIPGAVHGRQRGPLPLERPVLMCGDREHAPHAARVELI